MEKQTSNCLFSDEKIYKTGYYVSLFGTALILLWIGIFKFTPTEAKAIENLITHHPLSFWAYEVFSLQTVSNIIGVIEVLTAIGLILSVWFSALKKYVGWTMIVTFVVTLSYLFTTPNMWRMVDGVPVTDFFILKDILLLGFAMMLLGNSTNNK